jgi:D-alanine-D-alanine ligase
MTKTVCVIFGGKSVEHDVSIVTALASVIKPLELSGKYKVESIYIAKDGSWHWSDKLKNMKLFTSGEIEGFLQKDKPLSIELNGGFRLRKPRGIAKWRVADIDVVFPAMHGTYGEDGSLMGLLEMAGVAYVGCSLQASVVAMDKILAKAVARNAGLKTVPDVISSREEYSANAQNIIRKVESQLKYPAFVKPPHLGSSIGVTKVADRVELERAVEVALHYDANVLIEMAVPNLREATLPIMGYGEEIVPAKLEEPLFSDEQFFDFDTKYLKQGKGNKTSGTKMQGSKYGAQGYSKIPADFPQALYKEAETVAIEGFKALGCSGIARVDILINEKTKDVFFNEVNPMPGSLYAHNWNVAGVSSVELVDKLIYFAQKANEDKLANATSFSTSFLKQF